MIVVVAVDVPAGTFTSTAVQLIVYVPDWAKLGVPVNVRLGFNAGPAEAVPVKNGAVVVRLSVTFWASGSLADPVIVIATFSVPATVAGATITGFWFVFAITNDVDAVETPAVGVFVSVAVQLIV